MSPKRLTVDELALRRVLRRLLSPQLTEQAIGELRKVVEACPENVTISPDVQAEVEELIRRKLG